MSPEHKKLFDRGKRLLKEGKFDEAIAVFSKIINLSNIKKEEKTEAYFLRGYVYEVKGDFARAITNYDKAIGLKSDYAKAYYSRAGAYHMQGDNVRAIADYDKAIELDPNNAKAYYDRGVTYSKQGDNVRAIADYNQAIKLDPNYVQAYNNRGVIYGKQGDYARAIVEFGEAIKLKQDYSDAYKNRGRAYGEQGDYARSIADYDKAIEFDPNNKEAIHNRAVSLALLQSKAEQENVSRQYQEQLQAQREEFEKKLQEQINKYNIDLLEAGGYKEREDQYRQKVTEKNNDIEGQMKGLQENSKIVIGVVAVAYLLSLLFFDEYGPLVILPYAFLGTLVLSPQIWRLRLSIRDRNKFWALQEDAYANSILATLINAGRDEDSDSKKKLIAEYFDHHDKRGTARLIADWERPKAEGNNNVVGSIVERVKDVMPKPPKE